MIIPILTPHLAVCMVTFSSYGSVGGCSHCYVHFFKKCVCVHPLSWSAGTM